jgi:RIO kinase 3
MLNSEVLESLHGVVSTGKEANVYHAVGKRLIPTEAEMETLPFAEARARSSLVGGDYALKIFKTTLNEFKNREEYIGIVRIILKGKCLTLC